VEPDACGCSVTSAGRGRVRVIRGGLFLTGEQSVRLAIANSIEREKLLKVIVEEMRQRAKEAERRGPKR
jgi:hypothetical protein